MLTNIYNDKYSRIYNNLINKAKSENRQKKQGIYYENHHIIPRAVSQDDSVENMVLLTAKEHFVAHHLLTKFKITENKQILKKLELAFVGMAFRKCGDNRTPRDFKVSARIYEKAKIMNGKLASERLKMKHPMHDPVTAKKQADKIRGEGHHSFKGYYITPWGKYSSALEASKQCPVIIDVATLINWCKKNNNSVIKRNRTCQSNYLTEEKHLNKTFNEIGFSFEELKFCA